MVAPSNRNRNQSGSSPRSPLLGARKPLGVVSAPITSATLQKPEVYLDLGGNVDRYTVPQAWPEYPLPDRFDRLLVESRVQGMDYLDVAGLAIGTD